jgi:hypothetical protein
LPANARRNRNRCHASTHARLELCRRRLVEEWQRERQAHRECEALAPPLLSNLEKSDEHEHRGDRNYFFRPAPSYTTLWDVTHRMPASLSSASGTRLSTRRRDECEDQSHGRRFFEGALQLELTFVAFG